MCGIFACVGSKNAIQTTLDGLKKLEYRGYDSAGIAGISDGQLHVKKAQGKISELESVIDFDHLDLAIAHTRWATHGVPSVLNAHPQLDEGHTIALVHNGIIENYTALRTMLTQKGVHFHSDTDTEVVVNLIAHFYHGDILEAVEQAVKLLHGSYALALIHKDHPKKILGVAHQSPLCLGIGEGEMFLSSDMYAFSGKAKKVIFLENGEVAVIEAKKYEVFDSSMVPLEKETRELTQVSEEVSKEGFAHYTLKEIFEQPQTIRSALSGRVLEELGSVNFDELQGDLHSVKRIVIVACGTSWHAGFFAAYLLEELARIPTEVEISSEIRYKNPIVSEGTLVIAISQSGETADTLAAVRELKAKGAQILAICNVADSSIAREANSCIYLRAGIEIGVCSTKAFTSQVIVLLLFTLLMARERDFSTEQGRELIEEIEKLPAIVEKVLEKSAEIQKLAKKYSSYENFFFLGRRYMYPAALEGALKLKEISYINANGYPAGEMKHGPIALISENCPTVALVCDSKTEEKMISNLMEIKARKGPVIAIAFEELKGVADETILIPKTLDELSIVPASVVQQLFAYYIALERGAEIDQPKNLAKSVTVE